MLKSGEELGWKSAFEIYFERKVNEQKIEGKNHNKTIHLAKTIGPSRKDFRNLKHNTNQWRKKARVALARASAPECFVYKIVKSLNICFLLFV